MGSGPVGLHLDGLGPSRVRVRLDAGPTSSHRPHCGHVSPLKPPSREPCRRRLHPHANTAHGDQLLSKKEQVSHTRRDNSAKWIPGCWLPEESM